MANRYNDRDREERNYYTSRGRDREQGPQDWRESQNQQAREWYETEQPEYGSDFESGRFRSSGENRGTRSSFTGQGSQERYGRQSWGQEGGGGQSRSGEYEDYGQRGQNFGQGRQSFGQGRSQQSQFENFGQENWRTQRGSSQGQQYGSGQYGYGQRGQFSGRGPKGYRRSDDRIKEDINERLTQDPDIDAWEIEVQVSGGEVILTGTVDDRNAKHIAEDIAESVSGVRDVQNQIKVNKSEDRWGTEFKKDSSFSSELSEKDREKGKSAGQGGMKANIK